MSNIRVTYSGLIAFVVGIIGVFTGLLFVLMITRRLSPEEFGTWGLIGSLVNYFIISELILSFWSTRQIARGENIGRTSLVSSIFFSLISIPLYLVYVTFISESSSVDYEILVLGIVLIPVYFVSLTLVGINLGHKPHATSYALLIFEIVKIPLALALVVYFEWGVRGAILALMFAFLFRIAIQLYFAKPQLVEKFSIPNLKRWFKLSWIPLYSTIPRYIQHIDIALYAIVIGSVIGVAYFQAAFTVAAIIVHSNLISRALYPKLLAQNEYGKIADNLLILMYFSIPLTAIAIIFAKPALFALNPLYQGASLIVIFLSLKIFILVSRTIPLYILSATERVDVEQNPKFSKLIKSQLFRVPTVLSIFNAVYIALLITILFFLNSSSNNELTIVTWWAVIGFLIEIPITTYVWLKSKKFINFSIPYKNTLKYLGATVAFSLVYVFTSDFIINYEISIYKFLPSLILQLGICVSIYLVLTYVIDNKIRILYKSILNEILKK